MKTIEPRHLGDGVYATHVPELQSIKLTTGHHDEAVADHVVYIDAVVWRNLIQFVADASDMSGWRPKT